MRGTSRTTTLGWCLVTVRAEGDSAGTDIGSLLSQLDALASNPTGTMPTASDTPLVWMGTMGGKTPIGGSHGAIYGKGPSTNYVPVTADNAVLQMQGWDEKKLSSFKALLEANGIQVSSYDDLAAKWQAAVTAAAQSWQAYSAGIIDKPLTPEEAIRKMGEQQSALFGGGDKGPTTTTFDNTETSIDRVSAQEGRGMAYDASQALLGRGLRKNEAASFTSGYNDAMAANPSTTSRSGSTTSGKGYSNTSATSHTSGGIDPETYQREWAQSRPDYSEYQAATKFMDALVSALGRQVG